MQTDTNHKIVIGDARDMQELPDQSVQLIVTSPPYWQLKDYGNNKQIGYNDTYEEYINNLNLVWSECHRSLEDGCRLCINIGDQYARAAYYGRYKIIPIRTEIIKFCETIGFDYMGAIIWQKVGTMNTSGGASIMGSYPYPRNGMIALDYEFILLFKKYGTPTKPDSTKKKLSELTKQEWRTYFQGHWNLPGAKQEKHLAMFPEELPTRIIKMFSFVNDTILDPFMGSGTTALAAMNNNRNSIGYEINPTFKDIINTKLTEAKEKLAGAGEEPSGTATIDFTDANADTGTSTDKKQTTTDWASRINNLPYRFTDTVQLTKKTGADKKTYGSKIRMGEQHQKKKTKES